MSPFTKPLTRLFGRKWPAPVAEPMWPFFVAGGIIFYGVNSFANLVANTEEFKNDPRNRNAKPSGPAAH